MSREPRGVTGRGLTAGTDPYAKGMPHPVFGKVVPVSSTGPTSSVAEGPQTITNFRQMEHIKKRVKPLPPDANVSAIPANTKLFQLESTMVLFSCSTCRRSNIRADLLAVNVNTSQFTCSKCFTKLIRPKNFVPTRLVPFPSLLSWLNYQKPNIFDTSSANQAGGFSARPAEAVVPTGDRLATGMAVNGFASNDVRALPATAMVHEISAADSYGQAALQELRKVHPCYRLWGEGKCMHGSLCYYRDAPYKQGIEYLMGIATAEQCRAAGLMVDEVFNLPNRDDLFPSLNTTPALPGGASSSDIHNPDTVVGKWYARKVISNNSKELQLFHNGPIEHIIDMYVVFPKNLLKVTGDTDDHDDNAKPVTAGGVPQDAIASAIEEEDDDLGALLDGL